ncbi:signal peptidase I [Burkholderia cenocepacia]|uniref:Signal peptidase I n=2 Tax=Burkholderia cenocepacia TaxID=95486 RepID=B4EQH0_BURCJ|nr:signal peptidase I [Burkholderia cenocepacia]KIS45971.1 signal peptidase I [Burkholderia cepacia]EPZ84576.1 putative conjugative transfer signal peptidase TraF [Burkholderia cenocepacia K56-2Valvano]ERI28608.1 putative conjugative transfer signal peptidase TraF [Burkholderia cenocepacia BC7]ONR59008.1 signal peptidase I [Burkholderia cenocepacia]ONR67503.1 signal peptidase I [Burkholderia cenocepacia]
MIPAPTESYSWPRRSRRYCAVRLAAIGASGTLGLAGFVCWSLNPWFDYSINLTSSLPGTLYVTHIAEPVKRGDLVAFRWHGGATYPRGVTFIKRIAGAGGDVVSVRDGVYYVNGVVIGRAKTVTLAGVPLKPAAPGVIPDGHYFVATPNPNSLDSRYALTGNIPQHDVIGRAYEIF